MPEPGEGGLAPIAPAAIEESFTQMKEPELEVVCPPPGGSLPALPPGQDPDKDAHGERYSGFRSYPEHCAAPGH